MFIYKRFASLITCFTWKIIKTLISVLEFPPAILRPNSTLLLGQSLISENGCFKLSMQMSRNLELLRVSTGIVMWQTQTLDSEIYQAVLQLDGSLVLFNQNQSKSFFNLQTNTPGASLHLNNDGNLVMMIPNGNGVWNSRTWTVCSGIFLKIKISDY